jgi:hypothetical protein
MYCASRPIKIYYIFFRMQGITPGTAGYKMVMPIRKTVLLRPCYALRIFKIACQNAETP